MAENNAVKSRRDQHLERLRKKYPEKQFDDDEAIFGQISDDYDQFEQENSAMKEREQAFSNMFTSDPRSARVMMEWKNGEDPAIALLRIYGDDILEACNDPDKQDKIKEANKEFAERVAKEKEYDQLYDKNIQQSLSDLERYAKEKGLSDEDVDQVMEKLIEICRDMILGKFTMDTVEMVRKGLNHDADIAQAREEGEVAGKNTKIIDKLRDSQKGDGLHPLNGRNNKGGSLPKKGKSMFDWANEAN